MASPEVPLQIDLFTGEVADTRTDHQKRKDRARSAPQQMQMFRTPEIAGTRPRLKPAYADWMERATVAPLVLEARDTRTPEEIERDLMREAERQTTPMFQEAEERVIFDLHTHYRQVGLRERMRSASLPVRQRLTIRDEPRDTRPSA